MLSRIPATGLQPACGTILTEGGTSCKLGALNRVDGERTHARPIPDQSR